MLRIFALVCALCAGAAVADTSDRVEAAYRAWLTEVGSDRAVLSVWRGDQMVRDVGIGTPPDTPMALASLGKLVTGLCAATLMQRGEWEAETTAGEVLEGVTSDVTVAQLLTHSGGLWPDGTQGLGMLGLFGSPARTDRVLARRALGRKVQDGVPGRHAYNNENYAILGAMIAAHTGQSYAAYCTDAVLRPAGVTTAAAQPLMAGTLSFGGWQMTAADYARLMHWGYGPDGLIGGALFDWPAAPMGGGASYGVGMVQRAFRGGYTFWHFGLLCFPGRVNGGSYAVSYMQDWRVVVAFDGCMDWDQLFALDAALARAVLQ